MNLIYVNWHWEICKDLEINGIEIHQQNIQSAKWQHFLPVGYAITVNDTNSWIGYPKWHHLQTCHIRGDTTGNTNSIKFSFPPIIGYFKSQTGSSEEPVPGFFSNDFPKADMTICRSPTVKWYEQCAKNEVIAESVLG